MAHISLTQSFRLDIPFHPGPILLPFFPMHFLQYVLRKLLGSRSFHSLNLGKFWLQLINSFIFSSFTHQHFVFHRPNMISSVVDSGGRSLSRRKPVLKILFYHLTWHLFWRQWLQKVHENLYAASFPLPDLTHDVWASFAFSFLISPSLLYSPQTCISSDNLVKLR